MAPAGCGKTQLIADSLKLYAGQKPVLVLTHTHAGRGALEARLEKAGVPKGAYRVSTIDSWCIRLIGKFPLRSGSTPQLLRVENPNTDYAAIRTAALRLLASGDVDDVLAATYGGLLADEYQDCILSQHAIVDALARTLPTCVLGDPLQAIFDFKERTVHWDTDVRVKFPELGAMQTPWRWNRVGAGALGAWLLAIRPALLAGQAIDLRDAPREVEYIPISTDQTVAGPQRMVAARTKAPNRDGTVLVIADSTKPQVQREIASMTPGATTVEALDLKDLTAFAKWFNPAHVDSTEHLLNFAADMMTNLGGAELKRRLGSLRAGTARKEANHVEAACLAYGAAPSLEAAANLLDLLQDGPDVRVYRYETLHVMQAALRAAHGGGVTFYEATVQARERNRHMGRRIGRIAVGSTLLLKGLESDVAVVLNPAAMDPKHLYVALSRGARKLVVCSPTPMLQPAPARVY